jgi:FtsH-binding integral membrane protein
METNQQHTPEKETDSIAEYHNNIRQIELEGYALGVKKARNALYWTAGLVFLGEMIAMFSNGGAFNIYVLIIALFEAGIFIALALWTKKKPYTAIVTGLVAFVGIMLLSAVANTYTDGSIGFLKAIFSGLIVKIIILVNLTKAINDAKSLQYAAEEKS